MGRPIAYVKSLPASNSLILAPYPVSVNSYFRFNKPKSHPHRIKAQRSGFDSEATNDDVCEETRLRVSERYIIDSRNSRLSSVEMQFQRIRRSSGMSERWLQSHRERYAACDDVVTRTGFEPMLKA